MEMIKIARKTDFQVKAQAMVEFALALPILMLLVIGLLEVGRLMFIYGSVTTAAREAVRYASAVGVNDSGVQHFQDCTGIRAAAQNVAFLQPIENSDIHITYDRGVNTGNGNPIAIPLAGGGQIDPYPPADSCPLTSPAILRNGDRVVVQVSLLYEPILQFTPLEPFVITASSARTVIVNVAIEVTAPPQSWNPNATDTPTSTATPTATNTDTPTPSNTPTQTATATITQTPTHTHTATITPLYTYTPTNTLTASPQPSCSEIVIDRVRYNLDGFEARVLNQSLSTAYLVGSTLIWNLNYAPPMYLDQISFNSTPYFDDNTYTSPVSSAAPSIAIDGNGTQAMWIASFDNHTFVGAYSVTLTFAFPGWGSCAVSSGISNSSPTPSFTPSATSTPSPTATPVNCTRVTGGTLEYDDRRMYMDITNNTGATLNTTHVTVTWNHDYGSNGDDKTLRLQQVTLNGTTWSGNVYAPSYTVVPYNATIPPGITRITFTFDQDYKKQDGTERVVIWLSNNGCTSYSISNQ